MLIDTRRSSQRLLGLSVLIACTIGVFDTVSCACLGVNVCTPIDCSPQELQQYGLDPHYLGGTQPEAVAFAATNYSSPGASIKMLSNMPLSQIGGGSGASLYGWVDPQTNREYALMGRSTGTSIIDITNPASPAYVANVPRQTGTAATSWREPKVVGNTMYIGVDGTTAGMQIVDLTRVRNYNGTTLTLNADATYTGVTRIHTLGVSPGTNFLYATGTNTASGGLRVLDVTNPLAPTVAASWSTDGYTHENQVVKYNGPDAAYRGREISFSSNGRSTNITTNRFSIVDVTNKSSVVRLASKGYASSGYTHQGWLTEDQRYFVMNDELDETNNLTSGHTRTHFWDVSDLDNPVYKGFYTHEGSSIDHNLYIKDRLIYMSNYTSGLHIFALDNPASANPNDWMHEVASFDTYLPDDSTTFNGTWNNYPFFPSGNIAVSDINGGLFVLKLDLSITPEPATALMVSMFAFTPMRRNRP